MALANFSLAAPFMISFSPTLCSIFDDTYLKMSTIYNTPVVQRLRIATTRRNSRSPRRTESPWRGSFRKELDFGCIEQKTSTPFPQKGSSKEIFSELSDDWHIHGDAVEDAAVLWQEEIKAEGDDSQKTIVDLKKGPKQLREQEKYDGKPISLGEEKKRSTETAGKKSGLTLRDMRRAQRDGAKLDVSADWIHKTKPILTRLIKYGSSSPRIENRSTESTQIGKLKVISPTNRFYHPLLSANLHHVKSQRLPSLGTAMQTRNEEAQWGQKGSFSGSLSPIKLSQKRHGSF